MDETVYYRPEIFTLAAKVQAVGLTDRGQIRKGLRADFVLCDYNLSVKQVILEGEIIS